MPRCRRICLVVLLTLACSGSAEALARGRDVRFRGTCGVGASATLRLESHDGSIRLRFDIGTRRAGRWSVVIAHEGRVAWRGRARRHSGGARVRREIADFAGADRVTVRGRGPRGLLCVAAGTLPG